MIKNIAKIARVATIPPITVLGLLMLLYIGRNDVFGSGWQLFCAIFFLMIMPILAYPLSYIIPKIKSKGRDGQRNLAFMFCFLGYSSGLAYALLSDVSAFLLMVFLTYFLAVVILAILNRVVKIKASGHACSIAGPLAAVIYFLGIKSIVWCVIVLALVVWSSHTLKRHTYNELIFGSLSSVAAFFISLMIVLKHGWL
jgi:hypothetical protein